MILSPITDDTDIDDTCDAEFSIPTSRDFLCIIFEKPKMQNSLLVPKNEFAKSLSWVNGPKKIIFPSLFCRIVVVSSMLLKEGHLQLHNLNYEQGVRIPPRPTRTPVGYADSKLMNALFAVTLKERLRDLSRKVSVTCVSPGWCRTRLHRNSTLPWYQYPAALLMACLFMKSSDKVCVVLLKIL